MLESTPITLKPRDIDRISAIIQRFDPLQARISLSNVTVVLNNKDWRWLPSNVTTGRWAPDTTAANGYDPVQSQMVIYYGYEITGGSTEYLEMFTGLVEDDPQFDSKSGAATFTLVGKAEKLLKEADAQNVCTALANQATSPANGNSSNDTFSTQKKSLWRVENVRFGGVVKTQGDNADYTLQNLNDPEVEAKIKATATSIPGAIAVLWDGKQWHRDKSIKQLAELLCDEAGITSGDRSIEDAIFPGVDQSHVIDTEADMAASVLTNFDLARTPGKAKHQLYFARASWADWSGAGFGSGGYEQYSADPNNPLYPYNNYALSSDGALSTSHFLRVKLVPNGGGTTLTKDCTSTSTGLVQDSLEAGSEGPYTLSFEIVRTSDGSVRYTFTYSKDIDSNSKVWVVYGRSSYYGAGGGGGTAVNGVHVYDAGSISIAPTGRIALPEIDTTVAPISWLALSKAISLNGGTATIYTKVSNTPGSGYDVRVAVNTDNVPQSAFKRYVVIEIDTTPAADKSIGPEIDSITLNWRGSNLFIGSADFTSKSCIEAMQDLAELGGMEFGTKTGGVFYLRNKTVSGGADLVISQKNVVLEVLDFSMGYREVRNVGQVRYGQPSQAGYYYAEYSKTEASEAEPTSERRFGRRPIRLEISNLIFSQGAQVAAAIAQKLYEQNYLPKRRARVRCRIIPHLEMSDKVQLSFHDSPLIEKVIFGDPLQTRPAMGPTNTLARDILMKVVGKSDDLMKAETILDLEEVLS